jgi:glycosyltransferase involved in cell wall biosynthesis/O-antigen ligase
MAFPASLLTPGGVNVAAADVLLVVAASAWLARRALAAAPAPLIRGNPMFVPTVLFVGYTVASLAWTRDAHATTKTSVQMVEIVLLTTLLYASMPSSLDRIRRAMHTFVGVTCGISLAAVIDFIAHGASGATYLPGLHKNAAGGFIGVGLVLAFTLALSTGTAHRQLLRLACAVEIAGLLATLSRGAIAGSLVSLVIATLLLRRARTVTVLLALAAAAATAASISASLSAPIRADGGYDSSVVRLLSYRNGVDAIGRHPLLGTGAGTYWDFIPQLKIGLPDPNNLFLLTWAELGIGGLLVLLLLLRRYGALLVRARRLPQEARILAVAAGAAALSLLIHFQVDVTWNRGSATLCFALFGLLVAATRLAPAETVAAAAAPGIDRLVPMPLAETGRLRVLHIVSSSGFHGIERHVVDLVGELGRLSCDAVIACPTSAKRLRREAERAGIDVIPATGASATLATATLASAARRPPHVVHVHDGVAAALGWRVASATGARLVRTQHFVDPASTNRTGWRRNASLALHRAINAQASAIVAVSESVADAALARRETGRANLVVIPPGVVLPSDAEVEALVERRAAAPPLLATVGRLEPEKSHPLLLFSLAIARERFPALRLLIVGDGSRADELKELARSLGVDDAVEWTGSLDDPWSRAAEATIYVHPAAAEPHGLATAEAMARALPVLGIAAGGTAELVVEGKTGLLVPADDAHAFAEAIVKLVRAPKRTAKFGLAGRKRAVATLGIDATARSTVELYERLG